MPLGRGSSAPTTPHMKLAAMIPTPDVEGGFMAMLSGPFESRAKRASQLGFDGVELMVRDPRELDLDHIQVVLGDLGLAVPQLVTGEIFGADGLCLVTPSEGIYRRAQERLRWVIDMAARFGAYINIGRLRGRLDFFEDRQAALALAIDRFRDLSRMAEPYGVSFTLEPANRYEIDFIANAEEGIRFIEKLGTANIGLLLDLFHMNIEDASIEAGLEAAFSARLLWHIHVADSNRHYPGAGHLDYRRVIGCLAHLGYTGFLSGEMMALPDPDTAAQETVGFLRPLISTVESE